MASSGSGRGAVRDWMTREPSTVQEDCPVRLALARMRREEIRHLLVLDGDRLTGIVSSRDAGRLVSEAEGAPGLSRPVCTIMTEDPVTVAPEADVIMASRLLLERRIGALPVREGDRIVGVFTTADALEALLALVEPGRA